MRNLKVFFVFNITLKNCPKSYYNTLRGEYYYELEKDIFVFIGKGNGKYKRCRYIEDRRNTVLCLYF